MTTPDLPNAMVERLARKCYDLVREPAVGDPRWSGLSDDQRDDFRHQARILLAVAFQGCEVREEWGVRYTYQGNSHEVWRGQGDENSRAETARAVAQRRAQNIPDHHVNQLRAIVITTPTEIQP